jgi:hypothetical protein
MDHGNLDHRLTGLSVLFVIFAQAPVAIEPAQRPFDNPLRDDHKSLEAIGALGNLQADRPLRPQGPHPVHQWTGISLIRLDMAQPRKLVPEDR